MNISPALRLAVRPSLSAMTPPPIPTPPLQTAAGCTNQFTDLVIFCEPFCKGQQIDTPPPATNRAFLELLNDGKSEAAAAAAAILWATGLMYLRD